MSNNAVKKIIDINDKIDCKPFLKWVGGKSQLLPELIKRLPQSFKNYFEPFIGGGALFFAIQPANATLSDINPELINAYTQIRDNPEGVIKSLKKHVYDEKYFYFIRNLDRKDNFQKLSEIERASRLIYLNKTCYNGLYRVNSKGEFNTPFGRYSNPTIVDAENLKACSEALQGTAIKLGTFDEIEDKVFKDDFVYFDPPYVPLSTSSSFTSYAQKGFDLDMQRRLFELCKRLSKKRVKFMLSNSKTPFIQKLYKEFKIESVEASRFINSKADKRGGVSEVIVRNY